MAAQLEDIDVENVTQQTHSVQDYSTEALLCRLGDIEHELKALRELRDPHTQRGRELHSEYGSLTVEKHRRIREGKL